MVESHSSNAGMGLGIAGLVLGILSVPLGLMGCTFITGLVMGILGITLSGVGLSQARRANAQTGLIIAALIISIIGTSFAFTRLSNSLFKSRMKFDHIRNKFENYEDETDKSDEFDKAFDEAFQDSFDESGEKTMEETLESLEESLNDTGKDKHKSIDNLSEEEKARKLGRASDKDLKEFVNEIADSSETPGQ